MYIDTCNCMVFGPLNKYIVETYIYLKNLSGFSYLESNRDMDFDLLVSKETY